MSKSTKNDRQFRCFFKIISFLCLRQMLCHVFPDDTSISFACLVHKKGQGSNYPPDANNKMKTLIHYNPT
jgi:hypothetical protein